MQVCGCIGPIQTKITFAWQWLVYTYNFELQQASLKCSQ